MADLIDRQAAIDDMKNMYQAAEKWGREAADDVIKARAESCMATLVEMKLRIQTLPTAQPEVAKDINVPSTDCISRQVAIDALDGEITVTGRANAEAVRGYANLVCDRIKRLPSAQPEIIHCGDCKYQDENWRRVSVRWLPCMEVRTGSNWYCGSAERRTDEE